jgi:hypothetical protein
MEELKTLENLEKIDDRHVLLGQVTGRMWSKEHLHATVSAITVHDGVPEDIKNQFNVARNLALYSYYCYSFAPLLQGATFTVLEFALKLKEGSSKKIAFAHLLEMAVRKGWIQDRGFRHVENPTDDNVYSTSLSTTIPSLRNDFAHGSNQLTPDIIFHLEVCADFVNQLFPDRVSGA